MKDLFASPRLRLNQAGRRINELMHAVKEFFKDVEQFEQVMQDGPNNRIHIKLRFTRGIPEDLTMLTVEASEHLRSALDQSGYAAAVASGRVNPRWADFPFSDSAENLKQAFKRKS